MEGTASDTEQKTNQAAPEQTSNCRVFFNTSMVSLQDEHTQPESPSQLSAAADSESDSTCTREHFHAQSEVATTAAESSCRVFFNTSTAQDEHTQPESPSQLSTAADSESDFTCTRGEHFHAQSEVATTAAGRSVFFNTSTVQDEPESPSQLSTAADSESDSTCTREHFHAQSEVATTAAAGRSVFFNTSTVQDEPESPSQLSAAADSESDSTSTREHFHAQSEVATTAAERSCRVFFNTSVQNEDTQPESPSKLSTAADSESGTREHSHAQSEVATTAIVTGERKWSVSIASLVGAIPALLLGITLGYPSNALLDLTGEATELQPEYFFSDLMISLFVVSTYKDWYFSITIFNLLSQHARTNNYCDDKFYSILTSNVMFRWYGIKY